MAGSQGQMGVGEIVGVRVGKIVVVLLGVVAGAGKKIMKMKMEFHMAKAPVALGYCSFQTCVLAEKIAHPLVHHIQQGYLGIQVVVLNSVGLLDIHNCLNVET